MKEKFFKSSSILLILVILQCLSVANGGNIYPHKKKDNLLMLSELTMGYAIKERTNVFIYFHDPSCGSCQNFYKEFSQAAKELPDDLHINYAVVDVKMEDLIANKLKIFHFPTLIYYKNEKIHSEYNGHHTASDILAWSTQFLMLQETTLASPLTDYNLYQGYEVVILCFGEPTKEIKNHISDAIKDYDGQVRVIMSNDEKVKKKYAARKNIGSSEIQIMPRFSASFPMKNIDNPSASELRKDLDTVLGDEFSIRFLNKDLANRIENEKERYIIYFMSQGHEDFSQREVFQNFFKKNRKNGGVFLRADIGGDLGQTLANNFQVNDKDLPKVAVLDSSSGKYIKHMYDGEFDIDKLTEFLEDCKSLKAKIHTISQSKAEIKKPNRDGNKPKSDYVKVLRGATYESVISKLKSDVVVFMYKPVDENSRRAFNHIDSLGYQLRDNDDIEVAKIDVSKNDIDDFDEINQLPALVYYKKGNNLDHEVFKGDSLNIIYVKKWLREKGIEFDD